MSKCKWHECENEARAKSPFCGGTCKKRFNRASGTEPGLSGTSVPVEVGQEPSGTQAGQFPPEAYTDDPEVYKKSVMAGRVDTASSTQNTDAQEAAQSTKSDEVIPMAACLRGTPNAVHAAPGDSDYEGCVTPDRMMQAKKTRAPHGTASPVEVEV